MAQPSLAECPFPYRRWLMLKLVAQSQPLRHTILKERALISPWSFKLKKTTISQESLGGLLYCFLEKSCLRMRARQSRKWTQEMEKEP